MITTKTQKLVQKSSPKAPQSITDNSLSKPTLSKTYSIKIQKSVRICIAICDSDLIGKRFEEGKRQLDIRETFYKREVLNKEELVQLIKRQMIEDATFNIVGKESIQVALEAGLISKESISKIKNIPFALTLL